MVKTMDSVATLISKTYKEDDIGQQVLDSEMCTDIFVMEKSLSKSEFFEAGQAGLNAELVLITPCVNYEGQQYVLYNGKEYGIYRTYRADDSDVIELYLEQKAGVTNEHRH